MSSDISDVAVIAHCLGMKVQKTNTSSKSTIETKIFKVNKAPK